MDPGEVKTKLKEMFLETEKKIIQQKLVGVESIPSQSKKTTKVVEFKSLEEFYNWILDKDDETKLSAKRYFELYGFETPPVVIEFDNSYFFMHPKYYY